MNQTHQMVYSVNQMAILSASTRGQVQTLIAKNMIDAVTIDASVKKYSIEATRYILQRLNKNSQKISRKTHVFYNFKGGTGKSTLSSQIAAHLAILGYNVLAIDLDPQAHLTLNLGYQATKVSHSSMYDVLINGVNISSVIETIYPGLDIVPSNLKMTRLELPLSQKTRREEVLKRILEPIESQYDYIIIDTNPTFSILNVNALVCAGQINIVCATHPLSYHGLALIFEDLAELFKDMGIQTPCYIIPNLYEAKTVTAQEILGALKLEYPHHVLNTVIRKSEDMNLASKYGLPLCNFAKKNSAAFEDLLELTREILNLSQAQPISRHVSEQLDCSRTARSFHLNP